MVVRDAKRAAILFLCRGVVGLSDASDRSDWSDQSEDCGPGKEKEKTSCRSLLLVGEMWVSNPRPSEPQSDALTS